MKTKTAETSGKKIRGEFPRGNEWHTEAEWNAINAARMKSYLRRNQRAWSVSLRRGDGGPGKSWSFHYGMDAKRGRQLARDVRACLAKYGRPMSLKEIMAGAY
jgi:hypothetical protein